MILCPVHQSEFKLCHAGVEFCIVLTRSHLCFHFLANLRNTWIVGVLLVRYEQIQLRVFLYLYAQFIQPLDRSVAGEEVLWTWTECNNLQTLQTDDSASYRYEVSHHLGYIVSCAYWVLRNISFEMTHPQIVRAVKHTAECVATTIDHVAVALSCCYKHDGTVEILCNQCFWCLRTKVAKEYNQCIATVALYVGYSLEHVLLVFYCSGAVV